MSVVNERSAVADGSLTDAFAAFVSAASRLERTHTQLHDEVAQLRTQLEERNRALASSLAENERMRVLQKQILDALPCGVAVVDSGHEEIVLLNPEAERLSGIPVGKTPSWKALPQAIRAMIESEPSQAWRQGDEQQIAVHGAAGERWLTVGCTSIVNRTRTVEGGSPLPTLILTIRDTTSQKHAEEEREASRHMIALAEMATLLAHEIRNPLGSLELFATLLTSDDGLKDESRKWAQCLQAGVRSLSATVNNVLRFHAPGSAPLVLLKLREVLENGIEFVRPLAQQSGVNIAMEESLGQTEIMGDAGSLQQLLLNLACNSLRHTPAEGTLFVLGRTESRGDGRVAVVEFTDTGSGISSEDIPRIFEAGFSTNQQRTGLGLAVCERIMSQHHGKISVTSSLGTGATFRMEFPVL